MGLLAEDLSRFRASMVKAASEEKPASIKITSLTLLETELDRYAGATGALDKSASDVEYEKLWDIHEAVEKNYRWAVKEGKRKEANVLLDKYAGWAYLKGQPGQPGDLHPFPAPDEQ